MDLIIGNSPLQAFNNYIVTSLYTMLSFQFESRPRQHSSVQGRTILISLEDRMFTPTGVLHICTNLGYATFSRNLARARCTLLE